MILYDPEELEEELEEAEFSSVPRPRRQWKHMSPVWEHLKKKPEIEGSEEEGEEEEEEEEQRGLGLKLSTPTVTVEIQVAGGKSEEILKEVRETFSFVLRTAKKEGLL